MKNFIAILTVFSLLFVSCKKDNPIKPITLHNVTVIADTVANDFDVYLLDAEGTLAYDTTFFRGLPYILSKTSSGIILDSIAFNGLVTLGLPGQIGIGNNIPTDSDLCNGNAGVLIPNNIHHLKICSTTTTYLEIYDKNGLISKFTVGINGIVSGPHFIKPGTHNIFCSESANNKSRIFSLK